MEFTWYKFICDRVHCWLCTDVIAEWIWGQLVQWTWRLGTRALFFCDVLCAYVRSGCRWEIALVSCTLVFLQVNMTVLQWCNHHSTGVLRRTPLGTRNLILNIHSEILVCNSMYTAGVCRTLHCSSQPHDLDMVNLARGLEIQLMWSSVVSVSSFLFQTNIEWKGGINLCSHAENECESPVQYIFVVSFVEK